jgi:hypothetical protein
VRVGGSNSISQEEILVDLLTPSYPDIQIVDLPGFTKVYKKKIKLNRNKKFLIEFFLLTLSLSCKNSSEILLFLHAKLFKTAYDYHKYKFVLEPALNVMRLLYIKCT